MTQRRRARADFEFSAARPPAKNVPCPRDHARSTARLLSSSNSNAHPAKRRARKRPKAGQRRLPLVQRQEGKGEENSHFLICSAPLCDEKSAHSRFSAQRQRRRQRGLASSVLALVCILCVVAGGRACYLCASPFEESLLRLALHNVARRRRQALRFVRARWVWPRPLFFFSFSFHHASFQTTVTPHATRGS